jgi:hypothetical protein
MCSSHTDTKSVNGTHIAADALFLEKRRRGLVRFVNALVRHPILAIEQLVIMFLTVPTVCLASSSAACLDPNPDYSKLTC